MTYEGTSANAYFRISFGEASQYFTADGVINSGFPPTYTGITVTNGSLSVLDYVYDDIAYRRYTVASMTDDVATLEETFTVSDSIPDGTYSVTVIPSAFYQENPTLYKEDGDDANSYFLTQNPGSGFPPTPTNVVYYKTAKINPATFSVGSGNNNSISNIVADTSSVGEVYEGKTFTVPVNISDNPGFTACILEADYDKDALELTSITNGDVASSLAANDIATGTANITSDTSITKESGTLFNYTFKVKDGATPGDYDITMKYRNDDSGNFCNGDDDVPVTFVKGTVKVVEKPVATEMNATVWLSTETTDVNPGNAFDVDVYMKSDQPLTAGEVDVKFNPEIATLSSIVFNTEGGVSNQNNRSTYDTVAGTAKLSFYGNDLDASGEAGLKVATLHFEAISVGTSQVTITEAVEGSAGGDDQNLDQTVTISEEGKEADVEVVKPMAFKVIPYVTGHRYLVMYDPSSEITSGVPTYKGQDMFWSEKYSFEKDGAAGVWVCLTDSDTNSEAKDFGINEEGTKSSVSYPALAVTGFLPGDVSGNGKVNIIDAQAAYDLSNKVYSTYNPIDMLHWLMADVNGNGMIEASDPQAIQYFIHYGTFEQ